MVVTSSAARCSSGTPFVIDGERHQVRADFVADVALGDDMLLPLTRDRPA